MIVIRTRQKSWISISRDDVRRWLRDATWIPPRPRRAYAPEVMFDRLVNKRVRRKVAKAQGRMAGRLAVLIVDLAESEVSTQTGIPAYRRFREFSGEVIRRGPARL